VDAAEEPGFPFLGLALALCGSNRLSRLVRRPVRRRKMAVPPLLGNRRDHSEGLGQLLAHYPDVLADDEEAMRSFSVW
jgi:hypothetical protein